MVCVHNFSTLSMIKKVENWLPMAVFFRGWKPWSLHPWGARYHLTWCLHSCDCAGTGGEHTFCAIYWRMRWPSWEGVRGANGHLHRPPHIFFQSKPRSGSQSWPEAFWRHREACPCPSPIPFHPLFPLPHQAPKLAKLSHHGISLPGALHNVCGSTQLPLPAQCQLHWHRCALGHVCDSDGTMQATCTDPGVHLKCALWMFFVDQAVSKKLRCCQTFLLSCATSSRLSYTYKVTITFGLQRKPIIQTKHQNSSIVVLTV